MHQDVSVSNTQQHAAALCEHARCDSAAFVRGPNFRNFLINVGTLKSPGTGLSRHIATTPSASQDRTVTSAPTRRTSANLPHHRSLMPTTTRAREGHRKGSGCRRWLYIGTWFGAVASIATSVRWAVRFAYMNAGEVMGIGGWGARTPEQICAVLNPTTDAGHWIGSEQCYAMVEKKTAAVEALVVLVVALWLLCVLVDVVRVSIVRPVAACVPQRECTFCVTP